MPCKTLSVIYSPLFFHFRPEVFTFQSCRDVLSIRFQLELLIFMCTFPFPFRLLVSWNVRVGDIYPAYSCLYLILLPFRCVWIFAIPIPFSLCLLPFWFCDPLIGFPFVWFVGSHVLLFCLGVGMSSKRSTLVGGTWVGLMCPLILFPSSVGTHHISSPQPVRFSFYFHHLRASSVEFTFKNVKSSDSCSQKLILDSAMFSFWSC